MDRWCNLHDPFGETDVDAFYEAGARAKLMRTEDGLGFDPEAFAEIVRFMTDLPYYDYEPTLRPCRDRNRDRRSVRGRRRRHYTGALRSDRGVARTLGVGGERPAHT